MERELWFHLDSQITDYIKQGLDPNEAEARARREFGAMALARDERRDVKHIAMIHNAWLGQRARS